MDPRPLIHAHLRAGYSRQVVVAADDALKRRGNDGGLQFWRAFAVAREGNYAAAIRDLEALRAKRDTEYAALTALVYLHRHSKLPDRQAAEAAEAALAGM